MAFSGYTQHRAGGVIGLDLAGEVRGGAVDQPHFMIVEVIVVHLPDHLIIDLAAISYLSGAGGVVLTNGYVTALDHGTGYRVVGARDQARQALHDSAVHGWLADTDDPGALLLALLLQPAPPPRRRRCSDRRLAMASLHAGRLGLPGARMSERLRSGCLSAAGVGYCV